MATDYKKAYETAQAAYDNLKEDTALTAARNAVLNRQKFSYDPSSDPIYQQYRDSYMAQGQKAMADTVGKVSAQTGGYGNSYAQVAGQQQYQQYASAAADKVPELAAAARSVYDTETSELKDKYSLLYAEDEAKRSAAKAKAENAYSLWQQEVANAVNVGDFDYLDRLGYDTAKLRKDAAAAAALSAAQLQSYYNSGSSSGSSGSSGSSESSSSSSSDNNVNIYNYGYTNSNGNVVFYDSNGKSKTLAKGINPYTGTKNKDIGDKGENAFSNGYQPNNVGGKKLHSTGLTFSGYGKEQNVWADADGVLYIWNGRTNEYEYYGDSSAHSEYATKKK